MAYIYKPKPQKSYRDRERSKLYNNKAYRNVRNWYFMNHPLCQDCLADHIVTEGQDVHHILSPFDQNIDEVERWRRLMDENNLVTLCRFHHNLRHNNIKKEDLDEYNEMKKMRMGNAKKE